MPTTESIDPNCEPAGGPRAMAKPTSPSEALGWLHVHTAASRLTISELNAAFGRLSAETGFVLAKASTNG